VLQVTAISITPQTVSLPIGATQQFTATATYSNGTQGNVNSSATWTSSNTSVATMSATGVATGVAEGSATIEAAVGSVNASASLTGTPSMFVLTGALNVNRYLPTATLLQNGQVLVCGGSWDGTIFASCELYNPVTGDFSLTGSMNYARFGNTATLLQNGQVLIVGGTSPGAPGGGNYAQPVAELYNPTNGTFSTTGSLNTARSLQTANLLQNGQVLIAGGGYQTTELYNPSTGLFTYTGSMNTLRSDYTATLLNNGTVLVAGGDVYSNGVDTPLSSAELYNPATGTFSYTGSLITAQSYQIAALLNNGIVLITAGENTTTGTQLADAELYNPSTQTFTATGTLVTARTSATASTLSSGQVLVVGGVNNNNLLGNAELYNPTSGTFSIAGNLNLLRNYQTETLLNNGTVLIAGGADVGDAELYETSPFAAPYSLQITPATANVLIGGTQTFTAVDNNGNPRPDATWTVNNSSLASIVTNGNGTGTLTGIAAGQVTITATGETTTGQAQVAITTAYSTGGVIWSAPPVTGYAPLQLVQTSPVAAVSTMNLPDLYSTQLSSNGTQSVLQALTADGEQLWQTSLPPINNNSVTDGFGGLILTEYDTCLPNQDNPLTVVDLDPVFGQPVWQIQAASLQGGYCYGNGYDAPQSAVRSDGAVVVSEPTNNGFPPLTLVQPDGTQISYYVPPSIVANSEGQETQVQCCVGPPIVNTDGSFYVEYEVRNIGPTGIITSDDLYLMQINPSDSASSILLGSTTQNEAQLPGRIIPDGQGGVLATWTISPSNPPVPQYPYQAVDVAAGTVGVPYNLPFSPSSVTVGQFPNLLLGENGVAFATDGQDTTNGPVVASFSVNSGAVNWTYQVEPQYTLSLIAAADGNGLAAKTTDQSGNDTVVLFDANGNPTSEAWTSGPVSDVDLFVANDAWVGTTSGTGSFSEYYNAPVQLSTSAYPEFGGVGANNAAQDISVTNFSNQTGTTNQTTITSVLQLILNALPSNAACNNWLQGTGENQGVSGQVWIQGLLNGNLFGHGTVNQATGIAYTIGAFTGTQNPDGTPIAGLPTSGVIFTVNDQGAYFNQYAGGNQNQPFGVGIRNYAGKSLRAQATILIHEVAHQLHVSNFQSDFGKPEAEKANNKAVDANCRQLIEGLQ
jgi:hypothetical protein